ncbi:MAG: hypothetical protein WCO04_01565 [Pseudomonadota bacterium]
MSDFEPLTPSKVAALANAVQTLYQQPINDNISLTGTTAATTNTYLGFGYNVITTASATNYACRLPNPPMKGRSTVIVNNSGFPIVVYPSVTGGSINGVVNGSALVPSDGKAYTFFCYENPLPGAWSWTPPATNQYDSNNISVLAPGSSNVITASSSVRVGTSSTANSSLVYTNGKNLSQFLSYTPSIGTGTQYIFKPSTPWNNITKFKVYTNQTSLGSGITARLVLSGGFSYYNKSSGDFFATCQYNDNYILSEITSWTAVGGSAITTPVSANIGDPATYYAEAAISLSAPIPTVTFPSGGGAITLTSKPTVAGDFYCGDETIEGVIYEKWFTQYVTVLLIPRVTLNSAYQFRFFLEYN